MEKTTNTLPPHLQALVKALEAKEQATQKKFGFTITDVTPAGYGPRG